MKAFVTFLFISFARHDRNLERERERSEGEKEVNIIIISSASVYIVCILQQATELKEQRRCGTTALMLWLAVL